MPTDREFTKILRWPGYQVYRPEIDEKAKVLRLWVRRKRGNRQIECCGCGRKFTEIYEVSERAVRELPWGEFQTTVFIELYRVKCPECGVKREKVLQLPSKAPFSKRFEDAEGLACESAPARQVARQWGCRPARCGRSICASWSAGMRPGASRRCGRWGSTRSSWETSRSS
ncbi:MAG: transposase family protein [Bryobacteraceae bacterium]